MNRTQVARGIAVALTLGSTFVAAPAFADTVAQTLPFSQSWSNGLITAADNWSGVAGITGYSDDLAGTTGGVDPQTRLSPMATVKVLHNQTNTTISNGGLAEFEITDSVVAMQGSGTADAPNLVIHLDTTGQKDIVVSYKLRDLDGSADNAVQAVALQYRVGTSGDFVNVAAGYVADATDASAATKVTDVTATLPAAANNVAMVQVRILTTNAAGNDEWVGVDDISVTGTLDVPPDTAPTVSTTSPLDNATGVARAGDIDITFDEDVTLNAASVTLECGSGALPFALTGGPRTFTLNPDADLPESTACTVTIASNAVADVDANDPPDGLAANYVLDFVTAGLGDSAPIVSSTSPVDNATDVAKASNLDVTFSEDVALDAAGVTLNCGGGALPFALSGGPRTFTVNPDADLPDSANCTVAIAAGAVADADAMDPPDALAADYTFDFTVAAPPTDTAPTVSSSTPADDATGILENANASVTFSEDVALSAAGVTLDCGGGALPFALSGGPRTFTLNPDADLPNSATCVVTIATTAVSDADAIDPPDGLAANHTFDFTTVAAATLIGAVQGTGDESPMKDQTVIIAGVVTAKSTAGFWLQDAGDGNSASSDGIYVFSSSLATQVAIGDGVRVTGKVIEYKPAADPQQLYLTEIGSTPAPTLVKLSSGNPLPAAVDLSLPANLPTANGGLLQLERFEGMRVTVPSLDVVAPNGSAEYNSSKFSDAFFGVVSGTARPRREAGIDVHDLLPTGNTAANVARWDSNPELLRIRTNGVTGGGAFAVRGGTVVTNVTGPLDYAYRRYTIQNQGAPTVQGTPPAGIAVTAPDAHGFTVGSFNVENYTDTTATTKAGKVSRVVRDYLHTPDLLGFIEMGNAAAFSALTAKIGTDAVAAGQPDPNYGSTIIGTAAGTQQLAVAYKRAEVLPGVPRVSIVGSEEFGATEMLRCPDNSSTGDPLLDRPPLLVRAQVNHANGGSVPVSLMMLHLKALIDVDSEEAATGAFACFGTTGARNRAKRQQGAVYVANLVAARQTANPNERLILVGDYNAYEVNDGFADVVGTIVGNPAPDAATVQPNDGVDLVTPDLFNLSETAPTPYSYVFGGHAQLLDHLVVNQGLIDGTLDTRVEYAHVNADYNSTDAANAAVPLRSSDHDPVHLYAAPVEFLTSDLAVAGSAPGQVRVGGTLRYSITVQNHGGDDAHGVSVTFDMADLARFAAISTPSGWSCNTPAVGSSATFACTIATLADGANVAFDFDVTIDPSAPWTVFNALVTATAGSTDPNAGNDSLQIASGTALIEDAAVQLAVQNAAEARPGAAVTWRALLTTAEHTFPLNNVVFTAAVPAGMQFQAITVPNADGTSPTCAAQGSAGAETGASCTFAQIAPGKTIAIDFTAKIAGNAATGTVHTLDGTVTSTSTEASTANNQASAAVTVLAPPTLHADLALAIAAPAGSVDAGTIGRYDVTLQNLGPDAAQNAKVTMNTPALTRFAAVTAPPGWSCTTPAAGAIGQVTCTTASMANGATADFDIDVTVDSTAPCCSIAATATASTASDDAIAANDTAQATMTIATLPDLSLSMINNKGSALRGDQVLWTATISNAVGAMPASNVAFNVTLPSTVRFASITAPAGWSCATKPAVGGSGAVQCTKASLAGGASSSIELSATIAPNAPINSTIAMDANVTSASSEMTSSNNQASAPLTVGGTQSMSIFSGGFED